MSRRCHDRRAGRRRVSRVLASAPGLEKYSNGFGRKVATSPLCMSNLISIMAGTKRNVICGPRCLNCGVETRSTWQVITRKKRTFRVYFTRIWLSIGDPDIVGKELAQTATTSDGVGRKYPHQKAWMFYILIKKRRYRPNSSNNSNNT